MSAELSTSTTVIPSKRKRRNYQACEPCRIRKAKCERGSEDEPLPPPCGRCKRESIQSQCIIAPSRSRKVGERESVPWRPENDQEQTTTDHRNPQEKQQSSEKSVTSTLGSTGSSGERFGQPSVSLNREHSPNIGGPRPFFGAGRHNSISDEHCENIQLTETRVPRQWVSNCQRNLTDNVIQTLVSKPNDTLSLLFEAAERQETSAMTTRQPSPRLGAETTKNQALHGQNFPKNDQYPPSGTLPMSRSTIMSPGVTLASPSAETISIWESYPFVRKGWLTAREAISYIDLFFLNLAPLSPVHLSFYSDHSNHRILMSTERMLCTTILTISSRYHVLSGGVLRGDNIHRKFWLQWKKLYTKVMYAEETASNARTRTVGTIESFLLMTEWHPRALHFPPDVDEWDPDVMDDDESEQIRTSRDNSQAADQRRSTDGLEAVARRSDRMSWMLLGSALTLAHELGISDQRLQDRTLSSQNFDNEDQRRAAEFLELRINRPRRLLYIYINQMASRLGWTSMLPRIISDSAEQNLGTEADKQWHNAMSRWISLTRLMKTANDMLFSPVTAKHLLASGKYVTSLEHFAHLLQDWHKEYACLKVEKRLLDILFIEFQFTRAYINSLALQAVVERVFKLSHPQSGPTDFLMTSVYESHSVDWTFVQDVVDGSRKLLRKVIEMDEERGLLKYCPVRIFSRIISASILLLKATGVGARIEEAQISLELLDHLIRALRFDPVDELHLANQYATLLETYVKAFRRRFLRIGYSKDNSNRDQPPDGNPLSLTDESRGQTRIRANENATVAQDLDGMIGGEGNEFNSGDMSVFGDGMGIGGFDDDWMCLPIDAFDPNILEVGTNLGARGLDFFFMG